MTTVIITISEGLGKKFRTEVKDTNEERQKGKKEKKKGRKKE